MASCHTCVAATSTRGFLRCRTSAGAIVLHVGLFSLFGALILTAFMLLRSTSLLTSYSNLTLASYSPLVASSLTSRMSFCSANQNAEYSISFVSINDQAKAELLATQLVENRLAACVPIVPKITSIYSWKGKIEKDEEMLMIIKSRTSRLEDLTKFVVRNHPYELCEVTSVPIHHGNPEYLKWLGNHVPEALSENK